MRILMYVIALGFVFSSEAVLADTGTAPEPKLSLAASDSSSITAKVEAINHDTREITLRGPKGKSVSFVVSDAVHKLDQVNVGDLVTVDYNELLTLEVYPNDQSQPDAAEMAVLSRSAKGEAPAGTVEDTLVVTAIVEKIDLKNNTATLRGPDGTLHDVLAKNPDNLRRVSVGDLVVITTSSAVAVSVAPGKDE